MTTAMSSTSESPAREMIVSAKIDAVRLHVAAARKQGLKVGVVPTMGALHAGHVSLIEAARAECDFVVVTIFVNPKQFDDPSDFTRYPRATDRDLGMCEDEGVASAVLLRALEPTRGLDVMRARRGLDDRRLLCSGPGRLCQALGVTREHDGAALDERPFELRERETTPELVTGLRIGITQAADRPWRYGLAGSPFVSRRFADPAF